MCPWFHRAVKSGPALAHQEHLRKSGLSRVRQGLSVGHRYGTMLHGGHEVVKNGILNM